MQCSTQPFRARARRFADDLGASLVEYVLLVAFMAVVCIGGITFVGVTSSEALDGAGTKIAPTGVTTPPTRPPTTVKCKKRKKGC